MVTKTITVTEDAYNLLADNKLDNESFSGELKRILTTRRKKSLMDYFGILPESEGEAMLKDLNTFKRMNIQALKERKL